MADRYWVGGTGTWDAASTANWSTATGKSITASCATTTLTVTAGTVVVGDTVWSNNHTSLGTITANLGGGNWTVSIGGTFASQAMSAATVGASVPTAVDSVFFDANSNSGTTAFTVTMANTPRLCNDFTASGLDGTMTLAGSAIGLTVSGSLTFQATNFTRSYTGTTTFNATTTGKTITTNGVAFGAAVTLDGVGGAWTLGSAFSCGSNAFTLTNGTIDTSLSNYAFTCGTFQSTNSNTRTINLNASTITINAWNMTTSTNATVNAGTSQITSSAANPTFNGGGLTYYNLSLTSTTTFFTKTITGANTFNNLTLSTPAAAGVIGLSIGANQIINGTLTINGSGGNRRQFVRSDTSGTTRTLTCAAIAAMTDVDFRDITIAGAAGTLSGTRLGDCGGNSNITFVAAKTVYWSLVGGGNWSATAWAPGSGGTPAATNFPLAQDTAIIENTGLTTGNTITFEADYNIGTLDASTRTNAMTLASSSNTPTFYGNFTYGSGVTPTGTGTYTFSNRATKTLNSGGKTFTQPVTINAPGGGIQLVTNNLTLGPTLTTKLNFGTLDLNNLTLTTGTFDSDLVLNARTFAFGASGVMNCTGTSGTVCSFTNSGSSYTVTGTPVVNITSAGSSGISVQSGTFPEASAVSFNFTGGTYNLTFLSATSDTAKNVNFTGFAGTWSGPPITLATIFGNLTLSTGMTLGATTNALTFGATSGIQQITSNGRTINFPVIFNGVGGTFRLEDAMTLGSTRTTTLTNGTLDLNNQTLTTGLFSSSNSNTRTIAFGTGNITCSGTGAVWTTTTVTGLTTTGTQVVNVTSAGSTAISFSPGALSEADSISFNFTGGTYALTWTGSSTAVRNLNFTGYAGTLGEVLITTIYGNLTLSTGMSLTASTFSWQFRATSGTQLITTNGKTLDFPVTFNGVGGTFRLEDAFTMGSTRTMTLTNGTLNLNGKTCTVGTRFATATGTKNLTFNGGTLVCPDPNTTSFNNAAPTNFTTTAGTGTGTISMTAATAKTFVGGGSTYNCTLNQGGAGTLTITGANTFNDITNTNATASQITFPASTTTTVNAFTLSGSSGNLVSLRSSTPGTRFTLSDPSGTVSVSFLNIQDSAATGGATWNAFTSNGNVDNGNNLGWIFAAVVALSILATRLFSNGNLLINGTFDEVTQTQISLQAGTTTYTLYAAELDEITLDGIANPPAKRDTSQGQVQILGEFDETTTIT